MDSVTLTWQTLSDGYRHLVVTTLAGKWVLCNLRGEGPAQGLPCDACRMGMWDAWTAMLPPVATRAASA